MEIGQYLHITFEFWSAVFCIITALCVFFTRKYDRQSAVNLIGILTINALVNTADAMAYYYRGDPSELGYRMVRITNFAVFMLNFILLYFVMTYICRVVEKNGSSRRLKLQYAARLVIFAGMLSLIVSRAAGFYYSFDVNNQYYRLPSFLIMILFMEIPLILVALIIFSNWSSLKHNERDSFLLFILVPVIDVVAQLFVYGVSVTTIANNVAIFVVFISYEMGYADYAVSKEKRLLEQMTVAFGEAIDAKDTYTGGHSVRVAEYSRLIAQRLGLSRTEVERIYQMALLHDVGKIGIDDEILRKPSGLTKEEYAVIMKHPVKGSEILSHITEKPELSVGARWHHERYDGKGYPDGLSGEDIPLEARIICVADSYDAMTSDRSYRKYLPQEKVRQEIETNMGRQFDPKVAACMLEIIDEDRDYRYQRFTKSE